MAGDTMVRPGPIIALALLLATPAFAGPTPDETEVEDRVDWLALPTFDYTTDTGFGFGASGGVYWYRDGLTPYKAALELDLFLTTKWIQDHGLWLDVLEVRGLPLRIQTWAGYASSLTGNFCGYAHEARCDPIVAEAVADGIGLVGDERDEFLKRYYGLRHTAPYAGGLGLWRLNDRPRQIEGMFGWSGVFYLPGVPSDPTPWPDSLYPSAYAPAGERGFSSQLQVGVVFDDRDDELNPRRGYWIDASVRGASQYWGSDWDYVGANLTLRSYVPLGFEELVSASRVALDGVWGDLPTLEMLRMGGLQIYEAYGGSEMGRGIRYGRYLGRFKALAQHELRWTTFTLRPGDDTFTFMWVALVDAGVVSLDTETLVASQTGSAVGLGAGSRVIWNEDLIIRFDLAASPVEAWSPFFYIDFGQIF